MAAGRDVCLVCVTALILFFSSGLSRVLRKRGLMAIERLMGMILTTVAVEMFIRGIQESF